MNVRNPNRKLVTLAHSSHAPGVSGELIEERNRAFHEHRACQEQVIEILVSLWSSYLAKWSACK